MLNDLKYFHINCVARLAAIVGLAEVLIMLFFDYVGWEERLPHLDEALLDGMFLMILSIYPLYIWVYRPITARFKAKSTQILMLAEALQGAGNSVIITDGKGSIVYVNQEFVNITGYSSGEVLGKNPNILNSDKQDKDFYTKMWHSISHNNKWKGEMWNKRKNGEVYPETLDIRAIRDVEGDIKFLVGVYFDLAEQKQAESALIQSQKLEAVGTLVSGVAHNFNNLLAAISGKAYLGHKKAKQSHPEEPFTKHLADIKNLSLDASVLIKQLLSFSRESRHEKQNVDFTELVNNAVDTASFGLLKNIEMDVDLPGQSMMVHVDPVYLKQAIINLINNARDAVEFTDTKKITIRLAHVEHKQHCIQHQFCDSHSSDVAMLEIEDSGCGINSADIGKLFDPFFTTKPSGKGTGLGLSTTRGIMLAHNGSINVRSTFSKGTVFTICLPMLEQTEALAQNQSDKAQSAGTALLDNAGR